MLARLKAIEARYEELNRLMSAPGVINDPEKYQKYAEEHAELAPLIEKTHAYRRLLADYEAAKEIINNETDEDLRKLAAEEKTHAEDELSTLEREIKLLLAPRDERDTRDVIMEIRGATGGEEAALFAADLFRMYTRYADAKRWRCEVLNSNPTGIGGLKEVIFSISGKDAFGMLKYESGVHRVQRVPVTEASGRIHTSTVTVAVLPEAEEIEVKVDPKDLKIDVFRSSGPGGQSVNTTDSAVRVTHLPTGLVVTCQDEKSQHKNKARALRVLRSRLLDEKQQQQAQEISATRRSQVGTGERSERIRTYNFPQNRLTDHRIGLTLHKLEAILEGELDDVIEALRLAEQEEKLKAIEK
ncbi:MAG: peptide chain release factor 1 [Candidatus Abyssobacteria bacterium SURF_17]|uniref:Peptide chain release factor 1 n=1 Tax=Candidatus Abyssobacteria bacterium SURF_17 TaxID=2093361 RepID=A0A419F0N7_9BACT|nr:MAG: peptide chain release factor 1 [Candidatus Abyssubacteria bacterium SURF_17]